MDRASILVSNSGDQLAERTQYHGNRTRGVDSQRGVVRDGVDAKVLLVDGRAVKMLPPTGGQLFTHTQKLSSWLDDFTSRSRKGTG